MDKLLSGKMYARKPFSLLIRNRNDVIRFLSTNGLRHFSLTPTTTSFIVRFNRKLIIGHNSSSILDVHFYHFTRHLSNSDIISVEGPSFAESISEGDIRWIKKKGDFVNADDIVAEIETEKTSIEVPAPFAGTIVELLVGDGDKVVAKQKLYKLDKSGAPSQQAETRPQAESPVTPSQPSPPPPKEEKISTPQLQAKPIEKEATNVKSPPKIPELPKQPLTSVPVSEIKPKPIKDSTAPESEITGIRTETRVKMNRMRLRIAERLKEAQNTNAMLTTFNEIDLHNVMEMRKKYQELFTRKHGVKLSLMSPFIRASTIALQEQPVVNAVIENNEIVYRQYVDLSIAVATPKGLVVPVMRNVQLLNYAQIEKMMVELGAKARDNKLAIEDMEGGTFTISNGGVFGSMFGTPIINPPQSAILGMHAIFDRPVVLNGKVEIRPMMYVALTYDHRLIDGREAVTFLRKIKQCVEDPITTLLDL